MVYRYVRYNGHGLIIQVNFMVKCVCVRFGSNGFMTMMQPFPMDGHYRLWIQWAVPLVTIPYVCSEGFQGKPHFLSTVRLFTDS